MDVFAALLCLLSSHKFVLLVTTNMIQAQQTWHATVQLYIMLAFLFLFGFIPTLRTFRLSRCFILQMLLKRMQARHFGTSPI